MTYLGLRLKKLREELALSQEAMGATGFVSAPGWIKLENGQRAPSEKLIVALCDWLAAELNYSDRRTNDLQRELQVLKCLDHKSDFVRRMARGYAETTAWGRELLRAIDALGVPTRPRRGRPTLARKAVAA